MLTIFTISKPFEGHINIIQRNAIQSWLQLLPRPEIILFGQEKGMSETAEEFGIKHFSQIKKNEFGTPLLNSVFDLAKEQANNNLLAYVNSDIILMDDFMKAVEEVKKMFPSFLIISQRWNLDFKEIIDFNDNDWSSKLSDLTIKEGKGPVGVDCFVFPRVFQHNLPPFVVGRPGWDNWLLYRCYSLGIPLIDISKAIIAVHQNHDYSHYPEGEKSRLEIINNLKLIGGISHTFTPREATWIFTKQGLKKRKIIPSLNYCYRCLGSLPGFYPYFNIWLKLSLFPVWLLAIIGIKTRRLVLKRKFTGTNL